MGFATGVLMLWINPKAWTMAAAAAGAYASLSESPFRLAVLLGAVFGTAAAISLTLWCSCGAWLAGTIRSEAHWRALNLLLALALGCSIIPMWR